MAHLDIYSDIACPWCFIGKRRLEAALEALPVADRPTIRWHAYQLSPDTPEGPSPPNGGAIFAKKFGGEARMKQMFDRVAGVGSEVGIAFDFNDPRIINTRLAHRAVAIARTLGPDVESAVVEGLFKAHFEHHKDLGDIAVVVAVVAPLSGLDPAVLNERLTNDEGADEVDEDIGNARRFGLSGVPTFILDNTFAMSGGQPVEVFLDFFAEGKKKQAG